MYKLLALDIDGTLLNSRSELTPATIGAVALAVKSGIKVCLVSGRRPRGMAHYAHQLQLSHPMVCYNGGAVVLPGTLQQLHQVGIPHNLIREVLFQWELHRVPALAYKASPTPPDIYFALPPVEPRAQAYLSYEAGNTQKLGSLWQDMDFEPIRLMVAADKATASKAESIAKPLLDFNRVKTYLTDHYNGNYYYEIYPIEAAKRNGLSFLCEYFSITPEQVAAVGDHHNDLDMLEFAGLGVAMGNAQTEVKERADLVIGHHDEDGLAKFIYELIQQ